MPYYTRGLGKIWPITHPWVREDMAHYTPGYGENGRYMPPGYGRMVGICHPGIWQGIHLLIYVPVYHPGYTHPSPCPGVTVTAGSGVERRGSGLKLGETRGWEALLPPRTSRV